MRSFPSASRQRLAAAGTAAAVVLGAMAMPHAFARDGDDLGDRRNQVQSQIKKTQRELDGASRQAQRAASRLGSAQAQLGRAQTRLAGVREQLSDAMALDAAMQQALVTAEARLVTAREELAAGRAAAREQRGELADSVVTMYEQGDPRLRALSALVNAESLQDLELESEAERTLVSNESGLFAELALARARLVEQEEAVELARQEAERQRRAAARHLITVQGLETRAEAAAADVRSMVDRSRDAKQAAIRARNRDRAALDRLRQREARIRQLILKAAQRDNRSFSGDAGGLLRAPVEGPVTSPYGYRTHPIYGYYGLHNGTDFGAGCGQALFAGAGGTVVSRYYDEVYGNRLFLNIGRVNGATITLVYNHATGYRIGTGARVNRGDVIGTVGQTGWSTGCHLHFTVLRNGSPVNPAPYL